MPPTMVEILFAVIVLPIGLILAIICGLFFKGGRSTTPEELASDLDKFASGTEGANAWDELESVSLTDPRLEAIRHEAIMKAHLPLRPEDREMLGRLASKARALPTDQPPRV